VEERVGCEPHRPAVARKLFAQHLADAPERVVVQDPVESGRGVTSAALVVGGVGQRLGGVP
jgi:hypothetical protein